MKDRAKSTFLNYYFLLVCSTLASAGIIYFFEFLYGNADGIWMDRDVVSTAFFVVVWESILGLIVYCLFFLGTLAQNITMAVLTTLVMLWGVEMVCTWLAAEPQAEASLTVPKPYFLREDYKEVSIPDDTLGVRAKPNWSISWAPVKDGVQYDTLQISIDSLSRRVTPSPQGTPIEYALFLGCSYTYGDGVSDRHTLPSYFQSAVSGTYRAYNYGFMAYSPLHALARLQTEPIREQIGEKEGFCVYTFINDHVDRVIPATRWIELTKGKFPYLQTSTMQTDGVFWKQRRLYTSFILWFQSTGIRRYFNIAYPKVHTNDHFRLVVDILRQTKVEYETRFKNDRFYVVIFPGNPLHPEMKQLLEESEIKYLDYSKLTTIEDKMLPFDITHPSPEVYKMVGERLARDIGKTLPVLAATSSEPLPQMQ